MTETMRAVAVVPGRREVTLAQFPTPLIEGPGQALLRMLEVGVCGTDKEICAFDYGTPPPGSDRLVIGHESLAEVVETGPEVSGVRAGDLVVTMVRRPCPHAHCLPCRGGQPAFCSTGDFRERGIKEAHGFMTEFVVDEARYMVPVPATLRDVAVLIEPLTIAEKALIQLWRIQERLPWQCPHAAEEGRGHCHKALVLGAGPVGLLGALALAAAGFETFVYSREPEDGPKASLVHSFGGRYISAATDPPASLCEKVGGIDLVYEAVGLPGIAFEVMGRLAPNGVFLFTGVPPIKGPTSIDADRLMRRMVLNNQIVLGTVNAGRDAFEAAIRDLGVFEARWPQAIRGVITGRYPLEAYRDLLLGSVRGIKNVLMLQPEGRA